MKTLKNKFFIPIISCFLAIITIFSFYSLPKAKASQNEIGEVTVVLGSSPYLTFNVYDSYPSTINSYVDLIKGVDLEGSFIYFYCDFEHYTEIYFDSYCICLNCFVDTCAINLSCIDNTSSSYYTALLPSTSDYPSHRACFSLNTSAFPENTSFVVTDIKHYAYGGEEVDEESVKYDVLISPSSLHNFSDWVDEVPATETTTGVRGHYTCSHCDKYFNENYVEISNLDIPIKTDKPNNGGFSGSGVSSGASCSSTSIYGIFGIAIVFSFVAFAISHITKRKKPKRK